MLNSTSRQATSLANIGLKFLKLLWTSSDPYKDPGIGFHEKCRPRGERREWPVHQILYPSSEHWTSDVSAHPSKTQSMQHSSTLASSFVEAVVRPKWSVTPTSQTHQQQRLSKRTEECVTVKITAVRSSHLNLFITWQNLLIVTVTGLQVRPQKWYFA